MSKKVGFNINLSLVFDVDDKGFAGVWFNANDSDEVDAYLTEYLQDVSIFSNIIGDMISGEDVETKVCEVRYWTDE